MGRKPKDKSLNQSNKMKIFDWLKIIPEKQAWSSFSEEDKKTFEPFMLCKFYSMNRDYIEIINYLQFIPYSDKEKYYNVLSEFIPSYRYTQYIKGSKKTANKDILKAISKYYGCSLAESEQYVEFLGEGGVSEILIKLGIEDKEIKKLIKEL